MFSSLTDLQKLLLTTALLTALTTGTGAAQMTDLGTTIGPIGVMVVKLVMLLLGLTATACTTVAAFLTSQTAQIKAVAAMPGVETIQTNTHANAVVRAAADNTTDPALAKVEPPK